MTDKGDGDGRARHVLAVIGIDLCREVGHGFGLSLCPCVETTCTSLHGKLRLGLPCPSAADRESGIEMTWVVTLHHGHLLVAPLYPVACRLVAESEEAERWMIAIGVGDADTLVEEVLVHILAPAEFHAVVGPRRSFWLKVNAHEVGGYEGCLWRTIRMETHVVESPLLALPEHTSPRVDIRGRIAGEREAAVFHRSAQLHEAVVDIKHLPSYLYLPHAEISGGGICCAVGCYIYREAV